MAKVKSGGIRNLIGRVGGNVYYMNKGQNIARELAPAVSNPRSEGQMAQRMQWANMVALYRVNQPWMKRGAFESKKQTWSDYNAFVSANSGLNPVWLTKDEVARGASVIAPYIITKGSLPSVVVVADQANEEFYTDLYTGDDLSISGTTTAAELSRALLDNNNGLREGDQISAILNIQQTTDGVPYVLARYYEFIIDSTDNRTLADLGLDSVFVNDNYDDMERLCIFTEGDTCGCACVISRTISGNIQVSTQALVLTDSAITYNALYTTDAAFQQASQSYGETDANFLAAGYSGKASNVRVPVSQSILSVTIGDQTFTNAALIADRTFFGDVTPYAISVLMSQPPTEVTDAKFIASTPNGESEVSLMPATINGNRITCTDTNFNTDIGEVTILRLEVVADGVTYTL